MAIQRGTIQVVVSSRITRSKKPLMLLAKYFLRMSAKLTKSKIKWEARNK